MEAGGAGIEAGVDPAEQDVEAGGDEVGNGAALGGAKVRSGGSDDAAHAASLLAIQRVVPTLQP